MNVVYREPNGRASRAREPADKLALEVRARMRGLNIADAKDQKAETFIGTLCILGERGGGISERQYDALVNYLGLRDDYLISIKAANALRENRTGGSSGDYVSPEYEAWCEDVKKTYEAARKAIQTEQDSLRSDNLWAALDLCVIQDIGLYHMIGSVRILGNALARFFRT